jgi:hypothetical protein
MSFALRDGALLRDGQPFRAVGVNYHPSRAGCQLWTDWDPVELRRDLRQMAGDGFNTVRFFLFWRDFEPVAGRYATAAFDRLRELAGLAGEAGLACVISLLTIWMNGQRLDLPWRQGRSLWRDAGMVARQEAYASRVAATLRGLSNVLAVDLGDEIANVEPGEASALSREAVAEWQRRLATVLRRQLPEVLVCQANDASGTLGPSPFGVDNAVGLDLVATHGFPTWAPVSVESTLSYEATNLVPFLARFAGAYGVPFVDEIGSYGVNEATAASYLRAAAASTLANGAAGVLTWCWQDIGTSAEPYQQRPTERYAGLRRLDGTAKPALAELRRIARSAGRLAGPRRRARVALYVPELARTGGGTYLDAGVGTVATFYAYLLLKRAHLDADVVATGLDGYQLVICPSVTRVTAPDLARLRAYLDDGGTIYYSMGDHLHGFPGSGLAGLELVDYSLLATGRSHIRWGEDEWPVDWQAGGARPTTVAATAGETMASYPDGTPAVQLHRVGRGRMVFCAAPIERQLDRPGRLVQRAWERLYRRVAGLAGVEPAVDCDDPDVEIVPDRPSGAGRAVVVNHAATPVRTELVWSGGTGPTTTRLELAAKDWRVVDRDHPPEQ